MTIIVIYDKLHVLFVNQYLVIYYLLFADGCIQYMTVINGAFFIIMEV